MDFLPSMQESGCGDGRFDADPRGLLGLKHIRSSLYDGAARSRRGGTRGVFNPLCISPNLGGEGSYPCAWSFKCVYALVLAFIFGRVRTRVRSDDGRSGRASLPKIGEGSGEVDVNGPAFAGPPSLMISRKQSHHHARFRIVLDVDGFSVRGD